MNTENIFTCKLGGTGPRLGLMGYHFKLAFSEAGARRKDIRGHSSERSARKEG